MVGTLINAQRKLRAPGKTDARNLFRQLCSVKLLRSVRTIDKPLILYGAGNLGKMAKDYFTRSNIPLLYFVDAAAENVTGDVIWKGVSVLKPSDVPQKDKYNSLLVICITTSSYAEVTGPLIQQGWSDIVHFYELTESFVDQIPLSNGWLIGSLDDADRSGVEHALDHWSDDISRAHYLQFIAWHGSRLELIFDDAPVNFSDRNRYVATIQANSRCYDLSQKKRPLGASCFPDARFGVIHFSFQASFLDWDRKRSLCHSERKTGKVRWQVDQPLISICIPNYNNAKYLDSCLQSALCQTYQNIEIILVDDNSSDESLDIAMKYDHRINLVRNTENLGQPKNTNKSVEISRGEYVVILHSDDALLPTFAKELLPILKRHPNVGMAVGERMETDETSVPRAIAPFYNQNCIIPGEKQAKVFMMTSFLPCQVLLRRKVFFAAGAVDERHIVNLDGLLWFKCALQGDVAYTRTPVCIYRRHNASTTAQYNRSIIHMMEYYSTLSAMFKLAEKYPYLTQYRKAAERRTAELTVRFCHDVIRERNYPLARKFLTLATVFDSEIINNNDYQILKRCLESEQDEPITVYKRLVREGGTQRNHSYAPPEGFQPLW